MPRLTTKAAAELLNLPAYAQLRILEDQKYPRKEPQTYRTPYYSPALAAIRRFYRQGNDERVIVDAKAKISENRPSARAKHNLRILENFEASNEYVRRVKVRPKNDFEAYIGNVEVRLGADMLVHENDAPRVLFYNLRAAPIADEIARTALEIRHWIFEQNAHDLPTSSFEYYDFSAGKRHVLKRRRAKTIRQLEDNAKVIELLWESI